jgi:hypothetical protein
MRWAQLGAWAAFEARPLRQEAPDAPGCFVGRAGSLLGWRAALGESLAIPFLPHAFLPALRSLDESADRQVTSRRA